MLKGIHFEKEKSEPCPVGACSYSTNKHFEEFSEAAQVKNLKNDNNKIVICHFDLKISELKIL